MTVNLAEMLERRKRFDEAESLFANLSGFNAESWAPTIQTQCAQPLALPRFFVHWAGLTKRRACSARSLEAQRRTLGANHADTLKTAATLEAIRKQRSRPKEAANP